MTTRFITRHPAPSEWKTDQSGGWGVALTPAHFFAHTDAHPTKPAKPAKPAKPDVMTFNLQAAIQALIEAAHPERIILFGSHARGEAGEDSDLDFLVIESRVKDRAKEMVRLRRALRPLRMPVDVLVYSSEDVARWGNQPGSALYWALREGQVVYG